MKHLVQKYRIYGPRLFTSYAFAEIKHKVFRQLLQKSYSQCGEDLIIDKLLGKRSNGFYVDVGANDPHRFSNTKRFYERGWQGINIEPNPKNFSRFVRDRTRDLNLNIGAADTSSTLTFYRFIPDSLSTFSKEESENYVKQGFLLQDNLIIAVRPLADLLSQHCEKQEIDFISIDTEGFDLEVLKGNDWNRFRPRLVCIESVTSRIDGSSNKKEDQHEEFLQSVGYEKVADTGLNAIFRTKN